MNVLGRKARKSRDERQTPQKRYRDRLASIQVPIDKAVVEWPRRAISIAAQIINMRHQLAQSLPATLVQVEPHRGSFRFTIKLICLAAWANYGNRQDANDKSDF